MCTEDNLQNISLLNPTAAINRLGEWINAADRTNDIAKLDKVLAVKDLVIEMSKSKEEVMRLNYFLGNAYSLRHRIVALKSNIPSNWESDDIRLAIYYFRLVVNDSIQNKAPHYLKDQARINLSNALDRVGRCFESLPYLKQVKEESTEYYMALGVLGSHLHYMSKYMHFDSYRNIYAYYAHNYMSLALENESELEVGAADDFCSKCRELESLYDLTSILDTLANRRTEIKSTNINETKYRQWCRANVLFLCPLNDITQDIWIDHDCLKPKSLTCLVDEIPFLLELYNQIKSAYITARELVYKSLINSEEVCEWKNVSFIDTFLGSIHSKRVELLKMAYVHLYSVLDKIAFFLNKYLDLSIDIKHVYFKNMWRERNNKGLRDRFINSHNWPLQGLYALSSDLFYDEESHIGLSLEQEARDIETIRHAIIHRYFEVVEYPKNLIESRPFNQPNLANGIIILSLDDFSNKVLNLLFKVRSCIQYLTLGIHREEKVKKCHDPKPLPHIVVI